MSLTEKLAEYGMTEREDGTLMVPFEDHSGFVQVSVRVGRVWIRDLLADGRPAPGEFGEWRSQHSQLVSWLLQRDTPLADWLRTPGGASIRKVG